MNIQQFLEDFGHIASASGGVARLRELVLQLAISGRLTERVPNDVSASTLIDRNRKKQLDLVARKQLKRQHETKPVDSSSAPWALPDNWEWVRLGAVTNYGSAPKVEFNDVTENTWVLELEDIEKSTSRLLVRVHARDRNFRSTKNGFPAGAVLYGKLRPYLDKVIIAESAGVCTTEISPISFFQGIEPSYLRWYLKSPYFIAYASNSTYGMNLPRLGTDSARNALFPFPPEQEQIRIVSKINELMALCDTLESQQQSHRKLQSSLRQTTLLTLTNSESPYELQDSWARLEANFRSLFEAPEDVDDLIFELKNMAACGLLTQATEHHIDLARIKADCQKLRNTYNASSLQRKQKFVTMAESEFSYPQHWEKVAFDDVAIVIGGVTKGRDLRGRETLTCPYLSVANVQRGYFKLDQLKTIEIAKDELEKYTISNDDLLITEGGDWDKVGRTAIWRGGVDGCLHQNHVFKARIPSDLLLSEWVELVFNSGIGRKYFAGASKQTTNLASINMTQLRSFPLPIPPIAEQRAILDKLNELTQRCAEWRDLIARRQKLSALLAFATVALMADIDLTPKEKPVKAPQTELISRVRLGQSPSAKAHAPLATILARHEGELSAQDLWQRSTLDIDAFYTQLKTEVVHGWIEDPSYELEEAAPDGPKKYPNGILVAKVLVKEDT